MRFVLASLFCLSAFASSPPRLLETAPIRFEPDGGHWVARGLGYSFRFTDDATLIRLSDRTVKLTLQDSKAGGSLEGAARLPVNTNYFKGKNYASIPGFRRLRRSAAYPGIDVVYYGNGRQLEYDFEIAPGADPSRIRMRFDGADAVRLNERGEIVLTLGAGEVIQRAPLVYQRTSRNQIVAVEGSYRIDHDGAVRLSLGKYDTASALVVDPVFVYTTYLHGTASDTGTAIAHDTQGFVYLAGTTASVDFPSTPDAFQPAFNSNTDVWIMKLNPQAPTSDQIIVYSTFIGGVVDDTVKAMTIDAAGVIYFTGVTSSGDYPTTTSGYTTTVTGGSTHVFVSMIDPSQGGGAADLVYSTYLSGANFEEGDGIAVAGGKIYVTGLTTSDDFPIVGGFQTTRTGYDAFVAILDPTQSGTSSLVASTYLGGSGQDVGRAIAVDAAGNIWVGGFTFSFDFPVTSTAYQGSYGGDGDAFLAKLDPHLANLLYCTYFGGSSGDEVKKIVLEPSGHVAMGGDTLSSNFPLTPGAAQTTFGGNGNAFLSILDPTAPAGKGLVYSTYFGGTGGEVAYDLRGDGTGKYYLGGYTFSFDLPATNNALSGSSTGAGIDGFFAVIDTKAPPFSPKGLVYSSYLTGPGSTVVHGVDVGANGTIYSTGQTTSDIFPGSQVQRGADDQGKNDVFLLIFSLP
jgi:hypothetical protein